MKQIILVGDTKWLPSALSRISKSREYQIFMARDAGKALKLLKKLSPDFILCAGKIKQNGEGRYFLEV